MNLRTSPPVVKAMTDLAAIIKRKGSCSLNDLVTPVQAHRAGRRGDPLAGSGCAQREAHPVGNTGITSIEATHRGVPNV